MLCLIAVSVTGCFPTGPTNNYPGLGCIGAVRLTPEIIEEMNVHALARILEHNEREVARGCAVPNS